MANSYLFNCNICGSQHITSFRSTLRKSPPALFENLLHANNTVFSEFMRCQNCGHIRRKVYYEDAIMSSLYSSSKNSNDTLFSLYYPRARLVERDIRNSLSNVDKIYVKSITDLGGDQGQISRQLFNETKTICKVEEFNRTDIYKSIPPLLPTSSSIVSNLYISLHVLEHLENLNELISNISNKMTNTDLLFIEVPYEAANCYLSTGHYEHVQFFSENSLQTLLKNHDLRCTSSYCIGYGRSIPSIQAIAVKNASSIHIKCSHNLQRIILRILFENRLSYKLLCLGLMFLRKFKLLGDIDEYH